MSGEGRICATCRHFYNRPADLERALPGLISMSSGYASVRGRDGVCALHDVLLRASGSCSQHNVGEPTALNAA